MDRVFWGTECGAEKGRKWPRLERGWGRVKGGKPDHEARVGNEKLQTTRWGWVRVELIRKGGERFKERVVELFNKCWRERKKSS